MGGGDRDHVEPQTLIWGEWSEGKKRNCPDSACFLLQVTRLFVSLSCCRHTEFALWRESVGRSGGRWWWCCLRDSLFAYRDPGQCYLLPLLPASASAGYLPPRFAEGLRQQNTWRVCRGDLCTFCCPQEVQRGQQEARVMRCSWDGLIPLSMQGRT